MSRGDLYDDLDLALIRGAVDRGQTCVECHGPIVLMHVGVQEDGQAWREMRSAIYPKQRLERVLALMARYREALDRIAEFDKDADHFPPEVRYAVLRARAAIVGTAPPDVPRGTINIGDGPGPSPW